MHNFEMCWTEETQYGRGECLHRGGGGVMGRGEKKIVLYIHVPKSWRSSSSSVSVLLHSCIALLSGSMAMFE